MGDTWSDSGSRGGSWNEYSSGRSHNFGGRSSSYHSWWDNSSWSNSGWSNTDWQSDSGWWHSSDDWGSGSWGNEQSSSSNRQPPLALTNSPHITEIIEIESDEEGDEVVGSTSSHVDPYVLPDLSNVRLLSETAHCVEARVLDLPSSVAGKILLNARAVDGCPDADSFDLEALIEGLRPCVAFDIFKTLVFPERLADRRQSVIGLARHRGELQIIHRRAAEFLQTLALKGYNFCAISFIGRGNHQEFVNSLIESSILSLIPVVFIVFSRDTKAVLAQRLQCICAFDDQPGLISSYKRAGVKAALCSREFGIHTHPDSALDWIERESREVSGGASSSGGKGPGVEPRLKRADPY